jgi:hypothetical protein
MNEEIEKRIEYGSAEGKRLRETLDGARRMTENVAVVVAHLAAAELPVTHVLIATVRSCMEHIKGASTDSAVLEGALSGFSPNAPPRLPALPVDSVERRFMIHSLSKAVEAVEAAQIEVYENSHGDQRDQYAKTVSQALVILEGLIRQIADEGPVM